MLSDREVRRQKMKAQGYCPRCLRSKLKEGEKSCENCKAIVNGRRNRQKEQTEEYDDGISIFDMFPKDGLEIALEQAEIDLAL